MAITNGTKYVTVRRLERYKQKLANIFASKSEVDDCLKSITQAQFDEIFGDQF